MNTKSLGCIIQARMTSSRLPGKVMMNLDDSNTMLDYVVQQLKFSKYIKKIVVATTCDKEDDVIYNFCLQKNIDCFRGSSTNVLDRYFQCAKKFFIDPIVRVTSDCPLIDPTIIDQVIEKFKSENFDYVSNKFPRENPTFPQGTETEIFSFSSFDHVWKNAIRPSEKEHVTPYYYHNPSKFSIGNVSSSESLSHLRWTVDYEDDFNLIKKIVSKIIKRPILINDILELFSKEPELIEINKNHMLNEGYLKSINDEKKSDITT